MELKNFTPPDTAGDDRARADWALGQLRDYVASVQGFGMASMFDSYAAGGGLLVLLDGMDEVASDSYPSTAATVVRSATGSVIKVIATRSF